LDLNVVRRLTRWITRRGCAWSATYPVHYFGGRSLLLSLTREEFE
jgi:hypothetical protein